MQYANIRKGIAVLITSGIMIFSTSLFAAPAPGNGLGLGKGNGNGVGAPGAGGGGRAPGALPPGLAAKATLPPGLAKRDTLPPGLSGDTPNTPPATPAP